MGTISKEEKNTSRDLETPLAPLVKIYHRHGEEEHSLGTERSEIKIVA